MPDNTNVNANSAVVVVGRTAPVPPGQQKSEKSIPVVIANDQSTIPVAEQNKVQSEVALSLLGIPRSEVALGIFADVNTYDVNPTEWASDPEQFSILSNTDSYSGIPANQAWGLSHVPAEAGALVESPADKTAILTSKRFFRYQPGRVSAATFGVKTSTIADPGSSSSNFAASGSSNSVNGSSVANNAVLNPAVRKYGIFDKYDGYYWETRNNGQGDNFCVTRRTQSITYKNPLTFGVGASQQTQDYACTNPQDPLQARPSESEVGAGGSVTTPAGYGSQKKFGDLCILRDNLLMTHGGVFDPSLLQDEHKCSITQVAYGATDPVFTFGEGSGNNTTGIAASISNAVYDETTGIMVVTTHKAHGFKDGKYLTLAGIAMTCEYSYTGSYTTAQLNAAGIATQTGAGTGNGKGVLIDKFVKTYPNNRTEYNIIEVPSTTTFKINVGVSTVPTFYKENGWAVALSKGQYVSYSKGANAGIITGLVDTQIYKVRNVGINTGTGIVTCTFNQLSATGTAVAAGWANGDGVAIPAGEVALKTVGHNSGNENTIGITSHYMITPVPFIQPVVGTAVSTTAGVTNRYGSSNLKTNDQVLNSMGTGMFPYMYKSSDGQDKEGYIDTTLNPAVESGSDGLKVQIDCVNEFYDKWVNQNVNKDYWNVYEYRVPRSRFSGDRLDSATDNLLYSDSVGTNTPGSLVRNETTNEIVTDASIWNLEFDKVTMYKIEFSWYGAVGALFLAYVPVSSGEARWVRVHHLRASNQLKIASLGNATLPITYMCYGGGNQDRFGYLNNKRVALGDYLTPSEHIVKYGASYYIDGGDRGTVKLFSYATPGSVDVYGSKRTFAVGAGTQKVQVSNATDTSEPYIDLGTATGLSTSFYIGSRIVTGNPLDQNIEITYINANKAYLNIPLNSTTIPNNTLQIKPDRRTPLIGLKCRDFIQSSTGNSVRNRTQVYPTRMSTGSDQLVKVDFLKSPKFQTTSIVTNSSGPSLSSVVNIGKRGKPTKVSIPLTTYTGTHANPSLSTTAGAVVVSVASNGTETNKTAAVSGTAYNSTTGRLTIGMASGHGLTTSSIVRLKVSSISFTCSLDNNATTHTYPRAIDPIMDNGDTAVVKAGSGSQAKDATATLSKTLAVLAVTSTSITVRVTSSTTDTASAAEYIRDINTGVYGWFRGYFASDTTQKPITVFGYLENRGSDRTKNIEDDGYYFSADDSTVDDIILTTGSPFVREENSVPKDGAGTSSDNTDFQLEALSSIKINPQVRSPIPGTGTVVATVYAPPGGDEYDLSPYFDYNKEYLSFPLTDSVESLYLCASSDNAFNAGTSTGFASDVGINTISLSASLTWEEQ